MILQKFSGVFFCTFLCFSASAAPSETAITTETTIEFETTSGDISTSLQETSTSIIDVQQNEIDAKFPNDEKLTTLSDVDKKIESIVADCDERSTEPNDVTRENISAENKSAEEILASVGEVSVSGKANEKSKKIEGENVDFEAAKATNEIKKKFDYEMEKHDEPTSVEATLAPPKDTPQTPDLEEEKKKALDQVGNLIRAQVLRSVFMILNEVRQRQNKHQNTSESQINETVHYLPSDVFPTIETAESYGQNQTEAVKKYHDEFDCLIEF
jgi:hypothetical protein